MKNIVEIARSAKQFNSLVNAVTKAGLADTLQGPGPFTVFAPTDEAFAKLPASTLQGLLNDVPKLRTILTYHVVPRKVMARDVAGLKHATTVEGSEIHIDAKQGVKLNNNAKVTHADIEASNGVIHVIDTVLIPD